MRCSSGMVPFSKYSAMSSSLAFGDQPRRGLRWRALASATREAGISELTLPLPSPPGAVGEGLHGDEVNDALESAGVDDGN